MAPITRTCSLIALTLALVSQPAEAKRQTAASALGSYMQARAADSGGRVSEAVAAYSAALAADPASTPIALRAYRQALEAGNKPLALRALRTLETAGQAPVDGRLLLVSELFAKSDWRGAQAQLDKMEEAGTLAFLVPVLRAWAMQGAGTGDPLAALSAKGLDSLAVGYAQEHRALLLLANKQIEEGVIAVNAQRNFSITNQANIQLRLSAAQRLVELKQKDRAISLLAGDQSAMILAREELAAGRPFGTSITSPNRGMAMLLARVANDLVRDNASPVALTLARLANFADPTFSPARLVLARALSINGFAKAGVSELNALSKDKVTADLGNQMRLDLLISAELFDEAVTIARARAARADATVFDLGRLGEVYSRMGRPLDAAATYTKAIDLMAGPDKDKPVSWNLWLLLGRQYDEAKDWAKAKPALLRAVELGPNEASALNHLGYAMLVNGESVAEATSHIQRANKLRPDDAAITDSLGWALFKGGKIAEAIAVLERAAQSEPTIAEISDHLGDAYWAAGRKIDARYAWRAAQIQAEEADAKRLAAKIEFGPTVAR